jgi:hypothetical protein
MTLHYFTSSALLAGGIVLLAALGPPRGGFDIPWHTVDGGGGTSTGGAFTLSGTIGQHDAGPSTGPMTGGSFSLTGGFWAGVGDIDTPTCPEDLTGDGMVDGADLGQLLLGWNTANDAADLNDSGTVDGADLGILLLAWGPCP